MSIILKRNSTNTIVSVTVHLWTAITEVKRRGLPGTTFVKMNSNLVLLDFVKM